MAKHAHVGHFGRHYLFSKYLRLIKTNSIASGKALKDIDSHMRASLQLLSRRRKKRETIPNNRLATTSQPLACRLLMGKSCKTFRSSLFRSSPGTAYFLRRHALCFLLLFVCLGILLSNHKEGGCNISHGNWKGHFQKGYLPRKSKLSVAVPKNCTGRFSSQSCCFHQTRDGTWHAADRLGVFVNKPWLGAPKTSDANICWNVFSNCQLRQILMNMLEIWLRYRARCRLQKRVGDFFFVFLKPDNI